MMRRIGRRLLGFAGGIWLLLTLGFLMMHLVPGDPVRAALGKGASEEMVRQQREALGLEDPLIVQYVRFISDAVRGEFGTSLFTGQKVTDAISEQFGASLQLALLSFVVVILIAIPLGVVSAALTKGGRRRHFELGFTTSTVVIATVPSFILAQVLVYVFAVQLQWLPIAGNDGWESLILPVISLSVAPAAILARIVRVEVLAVLGEDFIRTARAKRMPGMWIYLREALPNAMTATLTIAGLMLAGLIAGTVLVESVFSWPGMGTSMVTSIRQKDYPMVQGMIIVYGLGVMITNVVVDIVLSAIDPRTALRRQESGK
ncbi:ABC transporter permease [Arthrobacter sp. 18067]|uniref:ABC transporter permease n=1 Tax=Arthrobacter sp. 18067 TaxID=2681413 RepID=UPI00135C1A09|nr:ABC transporter permease [Arthrobacter sp. 18067]